MTALALKADLDGTAVGHNQGIYKAAIGAFRDWAANLFGTDGLVSTAIANLKLIDSKLLMNLAPVPSVAANALTITLRDAAGNALSAANPAVIAQRSATAGSGVTTLRTMTADFSIVISSGSTLGHTSGVLCPIYLYILDNAGAQVAAVSGSFQGETGIYTTVAEGGAGAADSLTTMYAAAALAGKAGRLVAILWSTQVAAGTWLAVPSEVKMAPFHLETVGEIVAYGGGVVPYGFYLQDGSNGLRTGVNSKLFAKIGTNFGVGDGSTTMGLGDSRRRTLVGSGGTGTGTLGNAVGNSGGEEGHSLSAAENGPHDHPLTSILNRSSNGAILACISLNAGACDFIAPSVGSQGSGTAHNTIQPSLVVTKMIRWLGDI